MKLELHAVRQPAHSSLVPSSFGPEGGTIGRSVDCTMVVPDPGKYISRVHANINFTAGAYSLKVLSKVNPVIVNNVPISFEESQELKDGDVITLGDYEFRVSLATSPSTVDLPPPVPEEDPFASLLKALPPSALHDKQPNKDPFALDEPSPMVKAGLVSGLPSSMEANLDGLMSGADGINKDDPLLGILGSSTTPSGAGITDLSAPSKSTVPESGAIDRFLSQGGPDDIGPDFGPDFGKFDNRSAAPMAFPADSLGAHIDHVHDINLPFPTPKISGQSQADSADLLSIVDAPAKSPPPIDDDLFAGLSSPSSSVATPPVIGAAPQQTGSIDDIFAVLDNLNSDGIASPASSKGVPEQPLQTEAFQDPVAALRTVPADQELVASFLAGLGMPNLVIPPENTKEFMGEAGQMLRKSIEGVIELLLLRAEVKKELRTEDRTMIRVKENNPLKHLDSAEAVLGNFFQFKDRSPAFLGPTKAIQDAFNDLRAHELAVMAGMRAGLGGVIQRFEPAELENRIKKNGALDAVLPALYKSKLWDAFVAMHTEIGRDAEDHFDKLYGIAFVRAYMEQSKKLKK